MKKNKFRSTLLASVASATFALTSTNASARPEGAIALPSAPAIENMQEVQFIGRDELMSCLLYTSPSPRDPKTSRMPSSA